MVYKRDPNIPWFVRDPNHPATKLSAHIFAFAFLPSLVAIAWVKAGAFDPYTMSFFTKIMVEPTASLPNEMRIAGGVLIALGAGLFWLAINGVNKQRVTWNDVWIIAWCSVLIAAFGGSFFMAAHSAQERMDQEMSVETRPA